MSKELLKQEVRNGQTLGRFILYNGQDAEYTIPYAGFYYRKKVRSIFVLSSKIKKFEEFTLGEFNLKALKDLVNKGVVKFYRTTLPKSRKQAWVYQIDIGDKNER